MDYKKKRINWKPLSEYNGGRVLATNGIELILGEITSDGDCISDEDSLLCGITAFADIEDILPEPKMSEDEKIRRELIEEVKDQIDGIPSPDCRDKEDDKVLKQLNKWLAWLEKQGEQHHVEINDAWVEDYWKHHKINNPDSYNKGDEIQFDYEGFKRFCKNFKQKPAEWSEEDEVHRQWILECLADRKRKVPEYSKQYQSAFDWLKSLRPKLKQEWSKEDREMIDAIDVSLYCFEGGKEQDVITRIKAQREWLKSLKEQF